VLGLNNLKRNKMNKYNIRILKDTPTHPENTIISIEHFRKFYPSIISEHNTDEFLINYLKHGYKNDSLDIDYSKWFEVVEVRRNNFKVGSWVWHEILKKAFLIVNWAVDNSFQKEWRPNYISLEAANTCLEAYKRLATQEEINYYDLYYFCDGQVLIGEYKCYYFNNVWKELKGVQANIKYYFECYKKYTDKISVHCNEDSIANNWLCTFNGLKVGCKVISHEEIISIASILKIK
jgi:hypothetical protein